MYKKQADGEVSPRETSQEPSTEKLTEILAEIPAEKLAELRDNGALGQIYAHLVSLLGWDRLIAMAFARAAATPAAANA